MELYGNARLTVVQRRELAHDAEAGMTYVDAGEKYNSDKTAKKWHGRFVPLATAASSTVRPHFISCITALSSDHDAGMVSRLRILFPTKLKSDLWVSRSFHDAGHPIVFLGDSGIGKSHLLIGTGMAAAETGKRVRYVTCAALVNELVEAADDKQLSRVVARYGRLDLLCLDLCRCRHSSDIGIGRFMPMSA